MSLIISKGIKLRKTYIPPFPESPSDEDQWTDLNTGKTWEYSATNDEWTEVTQ